VFAAKSKEVFREVILSVPFRSVCFHCRRSLDFADQKYINLNVKSGYYCEECKSHLMETQFITEHDGIDMRVRMGWLSTVGLKPRIFCAGLI
jgi:hypothetical protein